MGIAAAVSYGLNPLFALPLYGAGLGVDSVLFYRYGFALAMLGVMMKIKGESFSLSLKELLPVVVMGLLLSFSSLFLFTSYDYMDVGIASTILFVYPVLVALIMIVFFHEKPSWITLGAVLMTLVGVFMLCQLGNGQTQSLTGVLLVFLSALTYALYIIGVNRSSLRLMPTMKLTFYALLTGILLYVVRLDFCTKLQPVSGELLWVCVVSLAFFPTVLSFTAMTVSIHRIGATPTAILGALEPVTAIFFGVMVFGEPFTQRIAIGVALILMAVTLIITAKPLSLMVRKVIKNRCR